MSISHKVVPNRDLIETAAVPEKFIHLLYAPTNFCNMGCQYCYLGDGTDELTDTTKALDTLVRTVDACIRENIIPFNISFHGGEVTAIPKETLKSLFEFSDNYYKKYGKQIKSSGFPLNPIHIKTNLYNFDKLYSLLDTYKVSVSGSVDLPLRLHEKYRTDKKGNSTLKRIKSNLKLLANYPHHKKISCVVTKEHMSCLDEFIEDIRYIHYDIGLDMSRFNIMFSFDSAKNREKFNGKIEGTEMLSEDEQVLFYRRMVQAFQGTELEEGLRKEWFKEFTPEFCCSAVNCGDKFFLLQSNGDVYACPRGQSSKQFFYGNVFKSEIRTILDNGWKTIEALENKHPESPECYTCSHLPYCNQGCIFVRHETGLQRSYTCKLQKAIYSDNPDRYPPFDEAYIEEYSLKYRYRNNIRAIHQGELKPEKRHFITPELEEEKNGLTELVNNDPILKSIYSSTMFSVVIDEDEYPLQSAILNNRQELAAISSRSQVILRVEDGLFDINSKAPINNTLHLMLLRNTMVTYGDEGRTKQEHIVDYSIYQPAFISMSQQRGKHLLYDLTPFLQQHSTLYLPDIRNNLLFTTKALREYHYDKQKKNAFYHIQAINLPFPMLEFYWID